MEGVSDVIFFHFSLLIICWLCAILSLLIESGTIQCTNAGCDVVISLKVSNNKIHKTRHPALLDRAEKPRARTYIESYIVQGDVIVSTGGKTRFHYYCSIA